jgi:hypothetical protein
MNGIGERAMVELECGGNHGAKLKKLAPIGRERRLS